MFKYLGYLLLVFVVLGFIYGSIEFKTQTDIKTLLSIATFTFAVFAGFFMQRQSQRYSEIRDKLTSYDGALSFIYRSFGHFGDDSQKKMGKIIHNHYELITKNKSWAYPFLHKTTTIIEINKLISEVMKGKTVDQLQNAVLNRLFASMSDLQRLRKNMIALYQEKIPIFQWGLLYFLATMLLLILSFITPNEFFVLLFKVGFGSIILFTIIILHKLNRLEFFEGVVGEHSAQDTLDIVNGEK